MRVRETVEVRRPAAEVYELLAAPERRPAGSHWSALTSSGERYEGRLRASMGPIAIDFDCRFELVERVPGERVRLRGTGVAPRACFTVDARFDVTGSDGNSRVDVDADVSVSGPIVGMGQRRIGEQARRLVAEFVRG